METMYACSVIYSDMNGYVSWNPFLLLFQQLTICLNVHFV